MHMLRTHLRGRLLWKCKVCTLSRIYACAFASNCSTFRIFIIALRNFLPWSQLNNDLSMMSFTAWALCTSEIRTFSAYNCKSRTVLNKTVVPNYLLVIFLLLPINRYHETWDFLTHGQICIIHFEIWSACLFAHIRKYLAILIFHFVFWLKNQSRNQ